MIRPYVLTVFFFLAAIPVAARGDTFSVCDSGCDFNSIASAHGAASPGDTLNIQGPITESGIVLTKNLIIGSTLPEPPIIQAATEPGVANNRVFYISSGVQVTLDNLVIRHGVRADGGGAILNLGTLFIDRSTVQGNESGTSGGAIFSQGANALLQITDSTIEGNRAFNTGGGIICDSGTLIVQGSTIAKNRAFEGGGIRNQSCDVTIDNSTISMNLSANGGAGVMSLGGAVSVNSSTFAYNSLRGIQSNGGTFSIRNSLLGNSLTFDFQPGGDDCAVFLGASITDLGFNIVEDPGSCTFGAASSSTGLDPGIGALADYGGLTRTHALLGISPALGSGDAGTLTFDQRGVARPQGAVDDVGAFEFRATGEFTRPVAFCAPVVRVGEIFFAEFTTLENRSANFDVQIQESGGGFSSFTPNFYNHGTYLGTLDEDLGAIAGATYFPNVGNHYYHVIFEDGEEWANEGGTTAVLTGGALPASWAQLVPEADGTGSQRREAEVGVDLPNDRFVATHASNPDDAVAMIEHSVMAANLPYLKQTGIQHRLGRVILRGDAASDPYAPLTTHGQYLPAVTDQWENVLAPGTHDLALVVRAESGAGLAPVGSIGDPEGYSSNDASSRGDFSRVWRHEGGHNWNLGHFDGGAPEGSTINSGNSLGRLSGPEQALVANFRDAKTAFLPDLGPLPIQIPPNAATDRAFASNQTSSLLIDVLANDHDANGDALTLVSIEPISQLSLGGTMALEIGAGPMGRDVVRYTLPSLPGSSSAIDRFSYVIRDSNGFESEGLVFVRVVDFTADSTYAQNFDAFANGTSDLDDGSYISDIFEGSAASVQGGALELTPDALGRHSSFTLPPQRLDQGYDVSFSYQVTAAGTAADGFAFNFGAPNATRIPVGGVGRFPSGLTVEWNTFAQPGYHVRVDGITVPGGFVASGSIADGNPHNATVQWNSFDGLTLAVDAVPIFTNLATPNFEPTSEDMLAFSALTIGLSEQVLIDDVEVAVPEPGTLVGLVSGVLGLLALKRRRQPLARRVATR